MNHIGLDNTVIVNRFQRVNPFDGSTHEHQSAISALYDASPVVECSEKGFLESLSSDYFSVPFIHVNENSSVEELEDAILKCKHMFLALPKESSGRKERLLDRLIELRRILQDVKEFTDMSATSSRCSLESAPSSVPNLSLLSRNLSQVSLPSLSYRTMSPEGTCPSLRHTPYPGGHDFQMVSAIRYLARLCEFCGRTVRTPTSKVFYCRTCGIICHLDGCFNELTRRCPGASYLSSNTTRRRLGSRRLRTDSESGTHRNSSLSSATTLPDLRHKISFKYLEVSNLPFISANLSLQSWICAECLKPINFTPSDTVSSEHLSTPNIGKTMNEFLETGIGVLIGKAFKDFVPKSNIADRMTPQLSSQQPSLSAYIMKLISPDSSVTESSLSNDPLRQYAISASKVTFEPIQTWYDACVMQALKKVDRQIPSSLFIDIQNGQLKVEKRSTESGLLENSSVESPSLPDPARLCYYSGRFYCSMCHWGDTFQIPACMFVMGDYTAKPVCRTAYLWLNYAWSRHLFCVPISWYYHEPLARLQPYFSVCSVARKFTLDIEKYGLEWFLEQPYTFTMDLISQVLNGKLLIQLTSLLSKVDEHVKQCQICETYVPSYCTVCNEGPVRPHYMKMTFCNRCNKTCHRSCLSIPLPIQLRDTTYYADIHQTYELSESDSDWDRIQDEWVEVLYPCLCVLCKRCGSNQVTLYSSGIL
ncbi:unnamed protein product [Heterobilharzia americana]|nr:unnamed protein product [Heterobilharzia americana]